MRSASGLREPEKARDSPSLGEHLATLGDLYLTFLWMLRQRLQYGPNWQYCHRWTPAHGEGPAEAAEGVPRRQPIQAGRG